MSSNDGLHGDDDLTGMLSSSPFRSASRTPEQGRSRRLPKNKVETPRRSTVGTSENDVSWDRLGGDEEEQNASTPKGTQGCVGVLQTFLVIFGVLQTEDPKEVKVPPRVMRKKSDDTMMTFDKDDEEDEEEVREALFRRLGFKDVRKP